MAFTRRGFMKVGAAGAVGLTVLPAFGSVPPKALDARIIEKSLKPDAAPSRLWAYDGKLPGPELRVRQGERLRVDFTNNLPQATSVHWHGIRIENAMDGVSGLTQSAVEPGKSFAYDFIVPDAGTYWYHPHNRSWEQLARGLYGPLVIEEQTPYPVDRDVTLVIDDWRLNTDGLLDEASLGAGHDRSHAGRLGNWATVNGVSDPVMSFAQGSRLRLRLINVANARIIPLVLPATEVTLIALDGQPLANPQTIASGKQIVLAPAQRADLVIDLAAPDDLAVQAGDDRFSIARFETVAGPAPAFAGAPVPALPSNGLPVPDVDNATAVTLDMTGGAMRWLASASYKGKTMDGRALAGEGQFWAFNGQVGMTKTPLVEVPRGRTVVIEMKNETNWPHAMHVHGHHFLELGQDNNADPAAAPWRDTLLMHASETKRIAFVADNPGNWMLHCHMLEHQAAGMGTWFRVV